MIKRLISAAVAVVILVAILFLPPVFMAACASLLSIMCLYEIFKVFSYHKNPVFITLGVLSSLAMPYADKLDMKWSAPIILIYVFILSVYMIINSEKTNIKDIALVFFSILIIPFCYSHLIYLRNKEHGELYIWLPFIGAFLTDTFAYFTGSLIGGRKLCERISPKKTVSGSIGGFFGSIIGFFVYGLIVRFCFGLDISYPIYFAIGALCGIVAQIGDLTASAIKRSGHIKDFGNIMPGHGGIMDRVDSLMFVAPLVFYMICVFETGVFF